MDRTVVIMNNITFTFCGDVTLKVKPLKSAWREGPLKPAVHTNHGDRHVHNTYKAYRVLTHMKPRKVGVPASIEASWRTEW
jgi:hypothetical protein